MKKFLYFLTLFATIMYADEKIYATFSVVPIQQATLVSQSSGIVTEILVDVGDNVQKGMTLLRLKDNEQKEQVAIAKAGRDSLQAKYDFARLQFERYEKSASVIDENTFDKIRFEFYALKSELTRLSATVNLQEELLANLYIDAPFDGIITQKFAEVGNGVIALNSPLFALQSMEKKLVLEFDSSHWDKIKIGDLFFYSKTHSIPITKIYPSIDSSNRKIKAEAMMLNLPLPSGAFGDGFIIKP